MQITEYAAAQSTLAEERQEVLESVLSDMAAGEADPDRYVACTLLLEHLIRSRSSAPGRDRRALRVQLS